MVVQILVTKANTLLQSWAKKDNWNVGKVISTGIFSFMATSFITTKTAGYLKETKRLGQVPTSLLLGAASAHFAYQAYQENSFKNFTLLYPLVASGIWGYEARRLQQDPSSFIKTKITQAVLPVLLGYLTGAFLHTTVKKSMWKHDPENTHLVSFRGSVFLGEILGVGSAVLLNCFIHKYPKATIGALAFAAISAIFSQQVSSLIGYVGSIFTDLAYSQMSHSNNDDDDGSI